MRQKSFTKLSEILLSQLSGQFPEWQKHLEIAESDFNNGKYSSLYIEVPSPLDKSRFLSILDRGDCIEVGFDDGGRPAGPAERQIICNEGSETECVARTIEFVKEIIDEQTVLGRELLFWPLKNKAAPPSFIGISELEKKNLVSIRSWKGNCDWELEDKN